eukprot:279948_1
MSEIHPSPSLYYIDIIGRPLSAVICIVILTCFHHISKTTPNFKGIVMKVNYGSIISFMMLGIFMTVKTALCTKLSALILGILVAVSVICYSFAQAFLYILLMLRIYYAFNNTKYQISRQIYVLFIFLLVLYGLCSLTGVIHYIAAAEYEANASEFWFKYDVDSFGTFVIGTEIIDLMISILLIALFIQTILKVTFDISTNQSEVFIDAQIAKLNDEQKLLLDISAKYFILSFVATFWTQLTAFLWMLYWIVTYFQYMTLASICLNVFVIALTLDAIINPICLYLILDVNDSKYQMICGRCHSLARLCCRRCTRKKVVRSYNVQNDGMQMHLHLLQ